MLPLCGVSRRRPRTRRKGVAFLVLAEIYDGGTRTDAARIGGVGLQTVRDWVLAFNANGPEGLIDGQAPGNPSKLKDAQRQALARIIESGPIPAIHSVVRWRLRDLAWWVFEEFRISLDETTVSREVRKLGFQSCRPARSTMPRTKPRWRISKNPPANRADLAMRGAQGAGQAAEARSTMAQRRLLHPPPARASRSRVVV